MWRHIAAGAAGIAAGLVLSLCGFPWRTPVPEQIQGLPDADSDPVEKIGALIKGLRSPDPVARAIFHKHLLEETGMFFGFKPAALPEERMESASRWETWWAENRHKTRERWLIDSLSLPGYEGKVLAIKNLVKMRSQTAAGALCTLLDEAQGEVRLEAVRALGELKAAEALARLTGVLESDRDVHVRRAAARSLGQVGTPRAIEALEGAAKHPDVVTRVEAACALSLLAPARAPALFHSLLRDGDLYARLFAIGRLAELRRRESVPHLAALLCEQGEISRKAREALRAIAGKDLGAEAGPWLDWVKEEGSPK